MEPNELYTIGLAGTVVQAPEPYRNIYGRSNVYALWLDVERDSGTKDRILVLFQEATLLENAFLPETLKEELEGKITAAIKEGSRVEVTGAIQTYKDTKTGRTQLFVWCNYIAELADARQELNAVYITGIVARQPVYRETPKGKRITDVSICIPSAFKEGFYSYIPCIAWGRTAKDAAELQEGENVYLEGRLQSREYVKRTPEGNKVFTTWEVSVNKLLGSSEEK